MAYDYPFMLLPLITELGPISIKKLNEYRLSKLSSIACEPTSLIHQMKTRLYDHIESFKSDKLFSFEETGDATGQG